jgi:pimeloyl-ACP methyl ester carboxylesterase
MNVRALLFVLLWTLPGLAMAQDCPDTTPYQKGRDVIRDLDHIVAPSGIQASYKMRIGGIDQWITVRGQDAANPVILFIHGGPASPLTPTLWQFQRPIEEYFTVVTWDQRGAGKTFREVDPATIKDTIHIGRYVDDAIAVAEAVRKRYHKNKIVLMGHSWGTVIGMQAALRRPDLFSAYVGIGQVINTRDNERISFDYAVEQARAHHNAPASAELASIAPYPGDKPITRERIIIARKWAQFYGGLSAFRESSTYYFEGPKLSPDYDAADVCAIDRGNLFSLGLLLPEFLDVDYSGVRTFPIPVVMFMGRHDYTTPSAPTAAWLARVQAPYKQAVWFEHSAHMIPWEEPGKTLVSLLTFVRPLAKQADHAGLTAASPALRAAAPARWHHPAKRHSERSP